MDNTIDKKTYNEIAFKKLLVDFLKTKPAGATQTEMVVATGLSKSWVELAVRSLLNDYPVRLETDDDYVLTYIFDFESRKTAVPLSVIFKKVWWVIRLTLTLAFKVWIVLMFMTYMLGNIIILISFYIFYVVLNILTRKEIKDIPDYIIKSISRVIAVLVAVFMMIFTFKVGEVIQSIFSYVFGQTREKTDDLELEKIILQYLKENQGKIVLAEIVQLTGWSRHKAQEEAVQLIANYDGEVEVTDEGVIVYIFPDLELLDVGVSYDPYYFSVWNRLLAYRLMNDNEDELNKEIRHVNAFNWVMSFLSPFLAFPLMVYVFDEPEPWNFEYFFVLSFIPFAYSLLFWLIPALRSFWVKARNRHIRATNEDYLVLEYIFNHVSENIYAKQAGSELNKAMTREDEDTRYYEFVQAIEKKAIDLTATSEANEYGNYYFFEDLRLDLEVIQRLRNQ